MLKIIYIGGWGRSGTTILDCALGQIEGFCSIGELHNLWYRGLVMKGRCGCGVPVPECPFWTQVLEAAFGRGQVPDPGYVMAMQSRETRTRHLPRLWLKSRSGRSDHLPSDYTELLGRLYHAIADVSGADVIVDSSKLPADGFLASEIPGVSVHVVHVVRDPRAVAYSWSKVRDLQGRPGQMDRHGPVYSSMRWTAWNAMITAILKRRVAPRYMLLRYEEFVADAKASLRRVLELVHEDRGDLPVDEGGRLVLSPTHSAWGNDSRFTTGGVVLTPDEEWREQMGRMPRVLATAAAVPLMPGYGYHLGRRA